jgi:hypothetical protein
MMSRGMAAITAPTPIFLSNKLKSAGCIVGLKWEEVPRAYRREGFSWFNEMELENNGEAGFQRSRRGRRQQAGSFIRATGQKRKSDLFAN